MTGLRLEKVRGNSLEKEGIGLGYLGWSSSIRKASHDSLDVNGVLTVCSFLLTG